jgi:urease accessory protein
LIMLREVREFAVSELAVSDRLTLPFELRQRSRLRAKLESGEEVALLLPRGRVLRGGDRLLASDGAVIEVRAAPEAVSTVTAPEATLLARCAYHLGNRHVPLEVGPSYLRYGRDHVLDGMIEALGAHVKHELAGFEPEAGAYGGHGHSQGHAHGHEHTHEHEHGHDHAHPHTHGKRP